VRARVRANPNPDLPAGGDHNLVERVDRGGEHEAEGALRVVEQLLPRREQVLLGVRARVKG